MGRPEGGLKSPGGTFAAAIFGPWKVGALKLGARAPAFHPRGWGSHGCQGQGAVLRELRLWVQVSTAQVGTRKPVPGQAGDKQ